MYDESSLNDSGFPGRLLRRRRGLLDPGGERWMKLGSVRFTSRIDFAGSVNQRRRAARATGQVLRQVFYLPRHSAGDVLFKGWLSGRREVIPS